MEPTNRQIQANNNQYTAKRERTPPPPFSSVRFFLKFLFSVLAGALVVATGPAAMRTAADASSVLLHILLELCRLSLFVLKILGK